jgi:hypothetical protein
VPGSAFDGKVSLNRGVAAGNRSSKICHYSLLSSITWADAKGILWSASSDIFDRASSFGRNGNLKPPSLFLILAMSISGGLYWHENIAHPLPSTKPSTKALSFASLGSLLSSKGLMLLRFPSWWWSRGQAISLQTNGKGTRDTSNAHLLESLHGFLARLIAFFE